MQKIKINGKNYSLPNNSADFLKKYLERLKEYTIDKKIDLELYQDIEERIAEKLHALGKKISQKDVVDIVNSLGEPEEIFSDFEAEEVPVMDKITKNGETFFKIVKEKTIKATDYSKKKFKEMKQKIDEKKIVERTKQTGKTVFQKAKNKATEIKQNIEEKKEGPIPTQTFQQPVKKGILASFFGGIFNLIGKFFTFIFGLIWTILLFTAKFLRWFFAFAIFGIFGTFFLAIVLALLIVAPLTYVDFVIDNQEVFAHISGITQWSFIVLFLSGAILMSASFGTALKQKWIPKFITFLATLTFFIGTFGTLVGTYVVLNEYSNEYSQEYVFDFPEYNQEEIVLENFYNLHKAQKNKSRSFVLPPNETFVRLRKSPNNNLKFEIRASIRAKNQEKADKILAELIPLKIENQENVFTAYREEEKIFSKIVPFSLLYYQVNIYIPENVKINFDGYNWYYGCEKSLIYNEEKNRFICEDELEFEEENENDETSEFENQTESGTIIDTNENLEEIENSEESTENNLETPAEEIMPISENNSGAILEDENNLKIELENSVENIETESGAEIEEQDLNEINL